MENEKLFKSFFSKELTPEQKQLIEETKKELQAKEARKEKSLWHFVIPDWRGDGGTTKFWFNDDAGTFEADDTTLDDSKIRDGIRMFAEEWTY